MSQLLDSTRDLFRKRGTAVRSTFDRSGRVISSRREQVSRHPRWEKAAAARRRQLQATTYDRDALIQVSEEATRATLALLDRAAPAVSRAFQEEVVPIGVAVLDWWPVDTGLSRSLYTMAFVPRGDTKFAAEQRDTAPYAYVIRFAKRRKKKGKPNKGKGRHVWTVLVRQPTDKAAKRLQRRIGTRVARGT